VVIFGAGGVMAETFKGIELDPGLKSVVPHMSMAQQYAGTLQHLQSVWDNLSMLGQLAGTGIDLSSTRREFSDLATDLLNQLGTEALKKFLQDANSKAQVSINTLVRNLFERTANIGFLASDQDIRDFLRQDAEERDETARAALRGRFGEYVRKYSVYSDVVLLDTSGRVVSRLQETDAVDVSHDAIIREAIETRGGYVERFGATDLVSGSAPSLIYAAPVDDHGSVVGVVCLVFRLQDEMGLIFSKLVSPEDWSVVTVLDGDGTVVASSDPIHIPLGITLTPVIDTDYKIVKFGPMEYIAISSVAKPYQGYGGPKWYGHVMVPLQHAFDKVDTEAAPEIDDDVLATLTHSPDLFSEAVHGIPSKAEHILRDLNQALWNGRMSQNSGSKSAAPEFSRVLLKEISETGSKTKDVFSGSIGDLHQTVVTSYLRDNQVKAELAIDVMDRNLYERAADCRWWALVPVFSEVLSNDTASEQDARAIANVLRSIADLYPVYTNLVVFDRDGKIVAVSDEQKQGLVGSVLEEEWVGRILRLRDPQDYVVSDFAPSPLYDDRHTYIYGAAIPSARGQRAAGGVACVFDAEPQLAAMLKDALPRDDTGNIKFGAMGFYVDLKGKVISCTEDFFSAGQQLPMDISVLRLGRGCRHCCVVQLGDAYYAVGTNGSSGYREYKGEGDAYQNDVVALISTRLGAADAEHLQARRVVPSVRSDRMQSGPKVDIATFRVGENWYAARTSEILEIVDGTNIVPLPGTPAEMVGCVMHRGGTLSVFDLAMIVGQGGDNGGKRRSGQIVVMMSEDEKYFGLLVDDLGEICEVLASRLAPIPSTMAGQASFADTAITQDHTEESNLIVVLGAEQLYAGLAGTAESGDDEEDMDEETDALLAQTA
jgi:chemotaxis signal transduction protein